MGRGRFITLEGTEGVGKSTNLDLICKRVRAAGYSVVKTREPGGTPLAEEIRQLLLAVRDESFTPLSELLLMFAARAQHLETVIKPALAAGEWVVCDRFTDATYAYQAGGRDLDANLVATLEEIVQAGLQPDLTFFLDVPVEVAERRIAERNHDRFEREERTFFENVRQAYLARAAEHSRIQVVDASVPLTQVQEQLSELLTAYLDAAG